MSLLCSDASPVPGQALYVWKQEYTQACAPLLEAQTPPFSHPSSSVISFSEASHGVVSPQLSCVWGVLSAGDPAGDAEHSSTYNSCSEKALEWKSASVLYFK